MLRKVVQAINVILQSEISWPTGDRLLQTEADFQQLCGLPGVVGAINGTHISISKPRLSPADYYYSKSEGYSLNCQAMVDSNKMFIDLFLGMPGSTNDSCSLRRSSLYYKGTYNTLWDPAITFHGFTPYLVGDSGYPLMSWLLVPHRGFGNLPVANVLFNKKLRRGRGVVENAFGILKQSFRELLVKSDLQVTFMPDIITCYAILHNVLLGQSNHDVEPLLEVLRTEGLDGEVLEEDTVIAEQLEGLLDDEAHVVGSVKRRNLGVHLALQRNLPLTDDVHSTFCNVASLVDSDLCRGEGVHREFEMIFPSFKVLAAVEVTL